MRLLIVEDEGRLAGIIARVFRSQRVVVEIAQDGTKGLEEALTGGYDVIILDRLLPGTDGVEVLLRMRRAGVETPVLMLTALSDVPERIEGLNAGADDYLGKPFSLDELEARIAALVRRRDKPLVPDHAQVGDLDIDFRSATVTCRGEPLSLSPQEYLLLEILARNRGQVLERDRILERVWGHDADPRGNVVELYIHYLRRKISAVSPATAGLISTVRGVGYLLAAGDR
jgi:DNA-binding response OmpR family regulator